MPRIRQDWMKSQDGRYIEYTWYIVAWSMWDVTNDYIVISTNFTCEAISFQVSLLSQCPLTPDSSLTHTARNNPGHVHGFCIGSKGMWAGRQCVANLATLWLDSAAFHITLATLIVKSENVCIKYNSFSEKSDLKAHPPVVNE